MTWNSFHNRGETLQRVVAAADARLDGRLPFDVDGARAVFDDDLDLLGALMLKWHTRLSGNIERALADEPLSPEQAVTRAWAETSAKMPGVRAILDAHLVADTRPDLQAATRHARELELARMAVAAGLASDISPRSARVGERIELAARGDRPAAPAPDRTRIIPTSQQVDRTSHRPTTPHSPAPSSFVDRIKAALAA